MWHEGAARKRHMDTFVDSSWYFYRFAIRRNPAHVRPAKANTGCRSTLQRRRSSTRSPPIYSRFFARVFRDLGMVEDGEPFSTPDAGMVLKERRHVEIKGNCRRPGRDAPAGRRRCIELYVMFGRRQRRKSSGAMRGSKAAGASSHASGASSISGASAPGLLPRSAAWMQVRGRRLKRSCAGRRTKRSVA